MKMVILFALLILTNTTHAQLTKKQLDINLSADKEISNVTMPGANPVQLRQIKTLLQKRMRVVNGSPALPSNNLIRAVVNSVLKKDLKPHEMPIRVHKKRDDHM